jgi:hypothetical protein
LVIVVLINFSGAKIVPEETSETGISGTPVPETEQDTNRKDGQFQNKTRGYRGGRYVTSSW